MQTHMHIQHKYGAIPEKAAGPGHLAWNSAQEESRRGKMRGNSENLEKFLEKISSPPERKFRNQVAEREIARGQKSQEIRTGMIYIKEL